MESEYQKRKAYSESTLDKIRADLKKSSKKWDTDVAVITVGSFARREASEESDLDYFVVYFSPDDKEKAEIILEDVRKIVFNHVPKEPSKDGAFNCARHAKDLLDKIGGNKDDNNHFTRRNLLLLEGEWLHNKDGLTDIKTKLLDRYLEDIDKTGKTQKPSIPRFLLSEFIRYYRTICVDFEFKTKESSKSWGIRNIKLVFSRKLLYFSGVSAVADTVDQPAEKMVDHLTNLLSQPVCDRLTSIYGEKECEKILGLYDEFLLAISDASIRTGLSKVTRDNRNDSEEYRNLKDKGYLFSQALNALLKGKFGINHPIHESLIF